jgi:hypothetical protein
MSLQSLSRILLVPFLLSLPLTAAGCGQTACLVWSEAEGACPAQAKAISFFSDPSCPGTIVSVDSEGSFGNDLCCYAVTEDDPGFGNEDVPCASPPGGVGGAGGSFGSGGAGGGCPRCEQALAENGIFQTGLCPSSQMLLDDLATCVCTTTCVAACQSSLCKPSIMADQTCAACLMDATMGCGTQFNACANDL